MVNLLSAPLSEDSSNSQFFTVEATGESGMNQTALAVLCGVTQPSISSLMSNLASKSPSKFLDHLVGKDLILASNKKYPGLTVDSKNPGLVTVYKASVCASIVQYYAFQGNEVAQYSLTQFIDRGVEAWIQVITGWGKVSATQTYVPYWYKRLALFTAKTRIPDGRVWLCDP
jgi:hypothetical protein